MIRLLLLLGMIVLGRPATAAITLPIEVLGAPGHIETVTLPLASGAASVTGLKLKVHGLTYENKASVRVNDSDWIDLNDRSVRFPRLERAYWGMGGTLSTLRLIVPLSAKHIRDGTNTIQFRFNDRDGKTVGYRVLGLNFVADDRELIPASEFVEDDPRSWKPPRDTADDIARGRELWYSAPLKDGGKPLRSFCTDCHAHDGRDLKYFNYSNKSIIERSVFHSISREDAERIASFIRSLDVPYEEKGRPWNPPYQPGPGMDAKPVRSWAAGAGLEAVLDDDMETLKFIFPNGAKPGAVDFKRTLNTREIPIAVQLPDWNHWLPEIHPKDAYPELFPDHPFMRVYDTVRKRLEGKSGVEAARIVNSQKNVWDRNASFLKKTKIDRRTPEGAAYAYRRRGLSHWRVVKTWEIMTEFQIEDMGHELWGDTSSDRRWFHGEVFRLAPHMLGLPPFDAFYTESMQWYQLQLVLNDGNRHNGSIVPIDWSYQHALNFSAWRNPADMPTYGIAVLNMVKAGEVGENDIPMGEPNAWKPSKQNITALAPGNTLKNYYDRIDRTLRRQIAEALLAPWLERAESFDREEYEAAGFLTDRFRNTLSNNTRELGRLGVDPALVERMERLKTRLYSAQPDKADAAGQPEELVLTEESPPPDIPEPDTPRRKANRKRKP